MWKFKPFMSREPTGLEGRTIDVGNVRVNIRNAIAEGGFSCVYVARDALNPSKQYALKHMFCNDEESLDLVKKEISVMKRLKGHPNVVTLFADAIFENGRSKEALLVMEFCEKSLVSVLENRGAGYFDEKQILLIFRDICSAVFAMHSQSPPIAHRDLKAENVLLGADGAWKLCDFGSSSTNHKCFDRPEEMGIEEDNIRKHTTPAYRAPEMWDLFRREVISEKVDIWALGCLLYRICYFKAAFDGESKLQILNGNFRIPELPKYNQAVTGLIKDMLEGSPDARPDITQVWFRVNGQLPEELQKHLPDGTALANEIHRPSHDPHEGVSKRTSPMPRRSPPPPPSSREQVMNVSPQSEKDPNQIKSSQATSRSSPVGSFWSTQHAQDAQVAPDKGPLFDEEPNMQMKSKPHLISADKRVSPQNEQNIKSGPALRNVQGSSIKEPASGDSERRFFSDDPKQSIDIPKTSHPEKKATFQNETFNTFVAEFDTAKFNSMNATNNAANGSSGKLDLEAEVERLKGLLKQAHEDKDIMASRFEKLREICRHQRQEIEELKQAVLAAKASPQPKENTKGLISPGSSQFNTPPREKIEGTVWELQEGMFASSSTSPSPDPKPWQSTFNEEPISQTTPAFNKPKSVRTTNGHRNTSRVSVSEPANERTWGFEDSFTAASSVGPQISRTSAFGSISERFSGSETRKLETDQPAGWTGF